MISGTGVANLGNGALNVSNALSGMSGGSLSAYTENIGVSAAGTFNQSGGTNNIEDYGGLSVGNGGGFSGCYYLAGPGVLCAGSETVGSSGTLVQTSGSNSPGLLNIGSSGYYRFGGGTLQTNSLLNEGVFDATQSRGFFTVAGNSLVDLSKAVLVDTSSMTVSIGPNSLLIVPSGFNPAKSFASYSNLGLTHTAGTTLTILPGQGFAGSGDVNDFLNCQGSISAAGWFSLNLNGGLAMAGTANVNLSFGALTANDSPSNVASGSLAATTVYIGNSGTGTFAQSGGTINLNYRGGVGGSVDQGLYVGYNAGDSGTYKLNNSGLLTTNFEYVGYSGNGAFNHSGGSNNISDGIYLGYNVSSSGSYNLSGQSMLSTQSTYVGYSGTGVFTQSGGTNAAGGLYLGYNASANGSYSLSGSGVLNASEYIGYSGVGTLNHSKGTNNVSGNLYLGYNAGSAGSYNLSGQGTLSTQYAYVGYYGTGVFTQSGGTNAANGLYLGYSASANGSYSLGGSGVLSASSQYVGYSGTGVFTQSGGTNRCSSLRLGNGSTYDLNGGLLLVSAITAPAGSANFTVNGGAIQASGGFSTSVQMTLGASGGATFDTAGYAVRLSGSLSGSGGLTKVDSGTLTLAATNTFNGNTLLGGGTLALASSLALQQSTLDTSGSGALSFGSLTAATLGGLTGPGALNLANSASRAVALSVGNNNASTTWSGAIKGGGQLVKIGSGTLTLNGSNAYTGPTTVNQGELLVNGSLASPVTVNSGGMLGGSGNLTSGTVSRRRDCTGQSVGHPPF